MKAAVLLLAAGEGSRLGLGPKAFVDVGGRTLLERSVRAFEAFPGVGAIAIAVPQGLVEEARRITSASSKVVALVAGGKTRGESVRRALAAVPDGHREILCHDVARPFPTAELCARVLSALEDADAVVPALPVSDTVKRVREGSVVETLLRDDLVVVQTPQGFRRDALERAHREATEAGVQATDDAALVERSGIRVKVVAGDPLNLKVTVPADLVLAAALAPLRDA